MQVYRKMEQKFTRLDDGRIKWEYTKDENNFEDNEFGRVGVKGGYDYIIFDSYEQAMSVLDRDIANIEKDEEKFSVEMEKNAHNLDKFTDLKELLDKVGELNVKFSEVSSDKVVQLYNNDPKKYQKLLSQFNSAKELFKDELQELSKEYGKMQTYKTAKKNYDFTIEQKNKILEQKKKLEKLNN